MKVKVIIAGSREFYNYKLVENTCRRIFYNLGKKGILTGNVKKDIPNIEIISGTARGADQLGEQFANRLGIKLKRFPANWSLGKRAGYIRNSQMADYAKEDNSYGVLIAFWNGKSKGTKHMINLAKENNLDINIIYVGNKI